MIDDEHKYSSNNVTINSPYRTQSAGNWSLYRYDRIVTCYVVGIKSISTKNQLVRVGEIPTGYRPTYGGYITPAGHKASGVINSNISFLFTFTSDGIINVCQYTGGSVDSEEFTFYSDCTWICTR